MTRTEGGSLSITEARVGIRVVNLDRRALPIAAYNQMPVVDLHDALHPRFTSYEPLWTVNQCPRDCCATPYSLSDRRRGHRHVLAMLSSLEGDGDRYWDESYPVVVTWNCLDRCHRVVGDEAFHLCSQARGGRWYTRPQAYIGVGR